jgi:hypothetical protein
MTCNRDAWWQNMPRIDRRTKVFPHEPLNPGGRTSGQIAAFKCRQMRCAGQMGPMKRRANAFSRVLHRPVEIAVRGGHQVPAVALHFRMLLGELDIGLAVIS